MVNIFEEKLHKHDTSIREEYESKHENEIKKKDEEIADLISKIESQTQKVFRL